MYEFSKTELNFLKKMGETGNGKDLISLLKRIMDNADRASAIPKGSDYGAQVEGRKLVREILSSIVDSMGERKPTRSRVEGNDEYD